MRLSLKMFLGIVLLAVVLITNLGMAEEPPPGDQNSSAKQESPDATLDIADVIPLTAKLSGRLADLKKNITADSLDISKFEKQFDGIDANLKDLTGQLERLKNLKGYKYNKLVELRGGIDQEKRVYEVISLPIAQAIRQLENWRKEWLTDQDLWKDWQSSIEKERGLDQLKSTFAKASSTIDTALGLVLSRLGAVLTVQKRAGNIYTEISSLDSELSALIEDERRSTLLDESPPMISAQFFSQLKSDELWFALIKGLEETSWPDRRFFARHGWIVFFQGFLTILVIVAVHRIRPVLEASKRWRFFAARPVSAGLFVGYMSTVLIYEYVGGVPETWKLIETIVGAISFARLMGSLTEIPWQRRFINALMIVLIVTLSMDALSFPIPLFRLYTALAAIFGLLFCWHMARASARNQETSRYQWLLRLGFLFFIVILSAELWGKRALATHLFASLIDSLATVLVFMLFMYMIHGAFEWLFRNSPLGRTSMIDSDDTETIIDRMARFIDFAIVALILLPAILMIWGVYDSLAGATKGVLSLGFNLGQLKINVGLLLLSAAILYGSFLTSWIVQKMLVDEETLFKRRLEKGVRLSMARLAHYAITLAGFLFAISALGFEISKITIMLSALGVGIGFGLQGIVNNFVSGLVLLFERPVRVGDVIQVTGNFAEIKKIGLRATTVQTFDRADQIIPNADLITNQVTNWTLSNRQIRLIIPVGVAYGSDINLVTETLMACAQTNPKVAKRPAPNVLFLSFGESSLDFELRVFVSDFGHRIEVRSALNHQIDRSFRAANIEIAFPQRDLHLRSVDESASLRPSETTVNKSDEPKNTRDQTNLKDERDHEKA